METNKPKKKIYAIVAIGIIAVLDICVFLFGLKKENEVPVEENTVVNYSCYNYIMDEMAKPQMYNENRIPQYDQEIYN